MELPEDEPFARLETVDGEVIAHRFNTSLFTHIGSLAMYDHIFVVNEDSEDDRNLGMYIFRQNNGFEALATYLVQNHFPLHANMTEVAECDKDAFDRMVQNDISELDGGVPEEWS